MTTLAHLSDVHFGRQDDALVSGLLEAVGKAGPAVVVVSGDLTQRARKRQFRAARAFLRELPAVPLLVVPGNHDISATNLVERTVRPLARYRRYITRDLEPYVEVENAAIAGINTVRVLSRKDGRINARQVRTACEQLERAASGVTRIVVTHHPIDLPAEDERNAVLRRAKMAMHAFAEARVDLFLSGHLHTALTLATSARYPLPGYSAVVAHAGTAVSTRTRGETNTWNLIRLERDRMSIEQHAWGGAVFAPARLDRYKRGVAGWVAEV